MNQPDTTPLLEARNLGFTYPRSRHKVFADFNLKLSPGHIYGLLGANGTGKSTLLYLLSGLLTPQKGCVSYGGTDVRRRLPATLADIFIVPDEFELPPVTLQQYVRSNSKFYPRFSQADMEAYLQVFGMTANEKLNALSLGQRKKIFMSFAMATHTRVLLMDEPTNGLDIPGKAQFRTFLTRGRSAESIFVVSTHQVKDIETVLDHVMVIDQTGIIADADMADICPSGHIDLEQFYNQTLKTQEDRHE